MWVYITSSASLENILHVYTQREPYKMIFENDFDKFLTVYNGHSDMTEGERIELKMTFGNDFEKFLTFYNGDGLSQAKSDMGVTEAIAELIPRQSELECYCRTLVEEDKVQLLERLDQQCRSFIVHSKNKLFRIAQQKQVLYSEINVRYCSLGYVLSNIVIFQYSSRFLQCALDDWEKYHRVSRAVSTIIYPMEMACNVHWKTQARCIYHRIIYTNIDIHEKLRSTSNNIQVRYSSTFIRYQTFYFSKKQICATRKRTIVIVVYYEDIGNLRNICVMRVKTVTLTFAGRPLEMSGESMAINL